MSVLALPVHGEKPAAPEAIVDRILAVLADELSACRERLLLLMKKRGNSESKRKKTQTKSRKKAWKAKVTEIRRRNFLR